jgi:hypothetical protein
VKTSENTNLCPEFLLKIQKQQEDSAMQPASNKQEHKEMIKNRETQQDRQRKGQWERTKTKWAYKKLPTYKTIQNHLEYPKC